MILSNFATKCMKSRKFESLGEPPLDQPLICEQINVFSMVYIHVDR